MKIIYSAEKKKILSQLEEQFGIKNIPYLLLMFGKDKIRLYSGNFSSEELNKLDRTLRIETTGLYFARIQEDGIRLTLDGIQILKKQIKKNILELNKEQAEIWFKGQDLEIKSDKAFKIISFNGEFIGCGKSTGERITNFVPKERRIK